ncbi:ribonuclease H-like domain-containing protein [Tanacetum coccineum]
MSQPANDDYSQHLSDDEASYHEEALDSEGGTRNSKKRISTRKDGVVRILLPVFAAEIRAVEKERKARTILLMAIPKEHLRRFHGMNDAKEIWESIGTRFQQLLSQLEAHGAKVPTEDANHKFLRSLPPAWSNLVMTMETKPDVDTLYIDDLYNNLSVFEQELISTSKSSASSQNVAFVSHNKSSNNKVKSGHTGVYSTYTPTSSNNIQEREVPAGFADEVIYSFFAEDLDLLHEDLEQIDDVDIEEIDINWQIAMIAIRMKKFYKKTGRRVRIDGNKPVGFDKKKLKCFKCHNTGHFARDCPSKGTNDGKKRDSFYQDQGAGNISVPNEMSASKSVITNEKVVSESKEVEPSCATHVKTPRQQMKNQGTSEVKGKNWNKMMERELGEVQLNAVRQNVNSVRPNINTGRVNVNSVRHNVNSVRTNMNTGNWGTAVKTSAGYNWRRPRPNSNYNSGSNFVRTDHPLKNMEDRGIFDSGCSGHMTGNKDHLDDFEEYKGGSVTFGGSKGYITGKGRIRVGTLQTPNANASEEADEDEELIVMPTAIKHSAAKVGPRKYSTNSKEEKFLTELQNLQTQEKEAFSTGISEDTPKILAY